MPGEGGVLEGALAVLLELDDGIEELELIAGLLELDAWVDGDAEELEPVAGLLELEAAGVPGLDELDDDEALLPGVFELVPALGLLVLLDVELPVAGLLDFDDLFFEVLLDELELLELLDDAPCVGVVCARRPLGVTSPRTSAPKARAIISLRIWIFIRSPSLRHPLRPQTCGTRMSLGMMPLGAHPRVTSS